jgi:hypothetical protein
MNISIYSAVHGKHLGTWYTEVDKNLPRMPQVPREGEIVWLETNDIKLSKFKVHHVEWSFKERSIANEMPIPLIGCEVWVVPIDRTRA